MSDETSEPATPEAATAMMPVGPAAPAPTADDAKEQTLIAPPKPAKAKKPAKGKATSKSKAKGKGKGKAGSAGSIASHPRAHAQIRRAKGWGGLGGFAIAAYLSHRAGVPLDQVGMRAVAAGIAGYMVAWACMVTIWRYLLLAEMRALADRRRGPAPQKLANPASGVAPPPATSPPAPSD